MRYFVLAILYCLLIAGCKKPVEEQLQPVREQMPQRTEIGANILACKVNGKVHIYQNKRSFLHPEGVDFSEYAINGQYIELWAEHSQYDDDINMIVNTWDIEVNKEYKFSNPKGRDYAQYTISDNDKYISTEQSGLIKFTRYDSLVAAGTFSFSAVNPSGEEVKITEGFFDVSRKE